MLGDWLSAKKLILTRIINWILLTRAKARRRNLIGRNIRQEASGVQGSMTPEPGHCNHQGTELRNSCAGDGLLGSTITPPVPAHWLALTGHRSPVHDQGADQTFNPSRTENRTVISWQVGTQILCTKSVLAGKSFAILTIATRVPDER